MLCQPASIARAYLRQNTGSVSGFFELIVEVVYLIWWIVYEALVNDNSLKRSLTIILWLEVNTCLPFQAINIALVARSLFLYFAS
jgi:hypothetical protein